MVKKSPKPALLKLAGLDRVFKTAWFAKEARKEKIMDGELCCAIDQVMQGYPAPFVGQSVTVGNCHSLPVKLQVNFRLQCNHFFGRLLSMITN